MTGNSEYPNCNIAGKGRLKVLTSGKTIQFRLIDMSAERIRIIAEEKVDLFENVSIHISLRSGIFEFRVNAAGEVKMSRDSEDGYQYEVYFTNLNENDRNEINDLMMSSCNLI
jgi:hypothetical protein